MCLPAGYIEPLPEDHTGARVEFLNKLVGNNVPPEFHAAIEKGFKEAAASGMLIGAFVPRARKHTAQSSALLKLRGMIRRM